MRRGGGSRTLRLPQIADHEDATMYTHLLLPTDGSRLSSFAID